MSEQEAVAETVKEAIPESLANYHSFRPSEVQESIWAQKFILFVENLSVSFDGFKAVDIPCFGIEHGELRVIIGPNGAGKTTFCDLVSGKTAPSTGSVYYDGRNITKMDESDIARMGIGRKFQTPTVFDSLTTYENLLLALPGAQDGRNNLFNLETDEQRIQIESIREKVNLMEYRDLEAKSLSHGKRQWLAISALIVSKPKL